MGGTGVNSTVEVGHWLANVQIVDFGNQSKHLLGGNLEQKDE